ncbi:MAG: glycosyltransferase family 9 protein [Candidatus Firestonebacteria bacterium]
MDTNYFKSSKKVLIIRFHRVGDVVLTLPAVRSLKKTYRNLSITMLVDSRTFNLIEKDDTFDEIIVWDKKRWRNLPKLKAIREIFKALLYLRKKKFDIVLDFQDFLETAVLSFLTGAKNRIGYSDGLKSMFYNIKVAPIKGVRHDVERYFTLLRAIDVKCETDDLKIKFTNEDKKYADEFLKNAGINENDILIGVNPGASASYKMWGVDNFSKLADAILQKDNNPKILVFWGPGEEEIANNLISKLSHKLILAPSTSLRQFAALVERCNVFITNDTGPMHIAAGMSVFVLAIFLKNHSDPRISSPLGNKHKVVIAEETTISDILLFYESVNKC